MDYTNGDGPVIGSYNSGSYSRFSKKTILIAITIALVLIGGITAIVVTMSGDKNGAGDNASAISENVASVNIDMTGFNPATIKVKKGQQVTWTSNDPRAHRITADQQVLPGFDSTEELQEGDSYTYVFETPGTYKYYDPADPKVYIGTITVE